MERFGSRIKNFRIKAGLSQKQVAEMLGIAASTYRDWEYGKQIKGEPYIKLAEVFRITVTELLTDQKTTLAEFQKDLREIERIIDKMRKTVASL